MKFVSTRGQTEPHSFSDAVRIGLAPDGGLFVPESLPDLSGEISSWDGLSYPDLCYEFYKHFATDIPGDELKEIIHRSYANCDHEQHAPLVRLEEGLHLLELFHGPTLAFKDFALQLVGNLYERQVAIRDEPITVLGATSGDTGAAAISGLLGKKGVNIFIMYPDGGRVSPLQERQMTCTQDDNVFPLAVSGNFDDAQAVLKEVLGDSEFSSSLKMSAVNSINIARGLAQCVYYLFAWLKFPAGEREEITFAVPTGNFGNVLSGWMVSRMGMRVAGFRVATNQNDILHRFFSSGDYSLGEVHPSYAPSMDIQVASNFERFIYYAFNGNPEKTRKTMLQFKSEKAFQVDDSSILSIMSSTRMADGEIKSVMSEVYEKYNYVVDPHTACGFKELDELKNVVLLSTAHPAKFPDVVQQTIGVDAIHPRLEALKNIEETKYSISPDAGEIKSFIASQTESMQV